MHLQDASKQAQSVEFPPRHPQDPKDPLPTSDIPRGPVSMPQLVRAVLAAPEGHTQYYLGGFNVVAE